MTANMTASRYYHGRRRRHYHDNDDVVHVVLMTAQLLVLVLVLQLFEVVTTTTAIETSYVMEPFENRNAPNSSWWDSASNSDNPNNGDFKVSFTSDSYAGDYALQVDYRISTTTSTTTSANNLTLYVLQENRPHICVGATDLSIWYYHQVSLPGRVTLRVALLDDSSVDFSSSVDQLEWWETSSIDLSREEDDDVTDTYNNDWKEIRAPLSNLTLSNPNTNRPGNKQLDPHRLRGFLLQLVPEPGSSGRVKVDQLACIGDETLLGAAFYASNDFNHTISTEGGWVVDDYESTVPENDKSNVTMDGQNGTLQIEYIVQQTQDWGGFLAFSYLAPGAAYYNVSHATHITFHYQINKAVSEPDRVHLRFNLVDASDCTVKCDLYNSYGGETEYYYSFHYILADLDNTTTKQLTIPLNGSTDSFDPFWLTGWNGALGNAQLNKEILKGYTFEFNMDSQGNISGTATGAITFSHMETVNCDNDPTSNSSSGGVNSCGDNNFTLWHSALCTVEPGIAYVGTSPVFKKKEFVGDRCCEICDADPTCLYVLSTGRDCFLASRLEPGAIGMDVPPIGDYSVIRKETLIAMWMDSFEKRGDFCDLCHCQEDTRTIDCRGKELVIVPKKFNMTFIPRSLDLRENPSLVLLGSGSLAEIAAGLEELWLPKNMIHLGANSLTDLPKLQEVRFEGREEEATSGVPLIRGGNIISDPSDYFGSVCCGLGNQVDLAIPQGGLTFCDASLVNVDDPPGTDSIYLPFTRFKDPTILEVKFPSSSFMAEAAASVGTCAEYCSISRHCAYFSYDNRIANAEPICLFLLDDGGGPETVCCAPGQYADEEKTMPGWTSGRPPATRHTVDNATVIVDPRALHLSPENDYQTYFEISLGATPLRGAVYVVLSLVDDDGLDVTIWPSKVGLYDANLTAKVNIKVSNVEEGAPSRLLRIKNEIESCDSAFVSFGESLREENGGDIGVNVSIPFRSVEESSLGPASYAATTLGGLTVLLVLVTAAMVHKNRTKRAVSFAQIEFLRLLLAGSLFTSIGAILVGAPPTDGTCVAAFWLLEVGYTLELVPLIVKVAALNRLMAAAEQMRRITLKRQNLFRAVALILVGVLVYMTLWSVFNPPRKVAGEVTTVSDKGYTTVTTSYYCSGYYSAWAIIAVGWNTVLLLSASVLAFQTSKIKRQDFNESQTLAFLIYSHFVFVILRSAILFLSGYVQEATLNHIRSVLFAMDTIASVLVYFLPKLMAKDDSPGVGGNRGAAYVTNFTSTAEGTQNGGQ